MISISTRLTAVAHGVPLRLRTSAPANLQSANRMCCQEKHFSTLLVCAQPWLCPDISPRRISSTGSRRLSTALLSRCDPLDRASMHPISLLCTCAMGTTALRFIPVAGWQLNSSKWTSKSIHLMGMQGLCFQQCHPTPFCRQSRPSFPGFWAETSRLPTYELPKRSQNRVETQRMP